MLHFLELDRWVVICFQISIFEPLETTKALRASCPCQLWFAFKLVSLNHWKQLYARSREILSVVICFQISIFEPLETTPIEGASSALQLWFAFKLVSLNHWKQHTAPIIYTAKVVICFQISIFEPLETTLFWLLRQAIQLWFAFKLVSLNHWKQRYLLISRNKYCCDLLSN